MEKVILSSFTQSELRNEIIQAFKEFLDKGSDIEAMGGCADGVELSFVNSKAKTPKAKEPQEKFLTRGDVANLLKISLPTLHRYTRDSVLKSYRIGGKVRYKLQEVENALRECNFGLPRKGGRND